MLRVDHLKVSGLPPISFSVRGGECLAIEGPSGSGKTRLLRAIADLEPSAGQVFFEGRERSETPANEWRKLLRFVSAEPGWWTPTARSALLSREHSKRFERISQNLGLDDDLLDRSIDVASTGERQRLALALALSDDPPVILLDEPTGALDATNTALVEEQLRYLLQSGRTLLLVSHAPDQIGRLASRKLSLDPGSLGALSRVEKRPPATGERSLRQNRQTP